MPDYKIAVLEGDGIGPEVTREAVKVLQKATSLTDGLSLAFANHSVGAGEYLANGNPLPESAFEACEKSDATLLGAMGIPDVRWPDGKEMTPQIDLRERLDLYFGKRPIYLFHQSDSPLKGYKAGEIDFVIVRENTEGLFSARLSQNRSDDEVHDVMRITRGASERICKAAFELATQRRNKVTLVDKANVLPSMVFFRQVFDEVAANYPGVETERVYVDAASLYLVQSPENFDVLVTENMFGDILSDLAAGLVGGLARDSAHDCRAGDRQSDCNDPFGRRDVGLVGQRRIPQRSKADRSGHKTGSR